MSLNFCFRLVMQSRIDFLVLKLTERVVCRKLLRHQIKSSCHYVPLPVVLDYTFHEVGAGLSRSELRQSSCFGEEEKGAPGVCARCEDSPATCTSDLDTNI